MPKPPQGLQAGTCSRLSEAHRQARGLCTGCLQPRAAPRRHDCGLHQIHPSAAALRCRCRRGHQSRPRCSGGRSGRLGPREVRPSGVQRQPGRSHWGKARRLRRSCLGADMSLWHPGRCCLRTLHIVCMERRQNVESQLRVSKSMKRAELHHAHWWQNGAIFDAALLLRSDALTNAVHRRDRDYVPQGRRTGSIQPTGSLRGGFGRATGRVTREASSLRRFGATTNSRAMTSRAANSSCFAPASSSASACTSSSCKSVSHES